MRQWPSVDHRQKTGFWLEDRSIECGDRLRVLQYRVGRALDVDQPLPFLFDLAARQVDAAATFFQRVPAGQPGAGGQARRFQIRHIGITLFGGLDFFGVAGVSVSLPRRFPARGL